MNVQAVWIRSRILFLSLCLISIAAPRASAVWMGEYFPLCLGATWTFENLDDPGEFYTETVLELIEYEGQPAMRYGDDLDNHTIVGTDRQTVTVYADVEDGVLYDLDENLVLGDLSDGDYMVICFDAPCDTNLIRIWENLDPSLRGIYGFDPGITDMLVIASYDDAYAPNLHNTVLESNLPGGVTPPAGAVTGIEWYRWHVGTYAMFDVDAVSGGLYNRTILVGFTAPVEDEATPARVVLAQNSPNPFNPNTRIDFELERPAIVTLTVHDCAGRLVRTLAAGSALDAGPHAVAWDGCDEAGRDAPSGTYVYCLQADDVLQSRRMSLVR